jgi:hypothetical protein
MAALVDTTLRIVYSGESMSPLKPERRVDTKRHKSKHINQGVFNKNIVISKHNNDILDHFSHMFSSHQLYVGSNNSHYVARVIR